MDGTGAQATDGLQMLGRGVAFVLVKAVLREAVVQRGHLEVACGFARIEAADIGLCFASPSTIARAGHGMSGHMLPSIHTSLGSTFKASTARRITQAKRAGC